ncbi:hypothetical protein Verru16b_02827 [Lacunisphaera limnophila]|uniref:Glycosyl transferases group 1 n=1 Tax=Lacunisphaera limnophila TaxID=1838286 RepID=A0A1D8AXY2_9BACT|nr:glycosyltransferase [Lacunisphaera limnophila]AOS45740.1 hypothetical protein Verru16b_02827 [Lacunisphaera limnophila]
MLLYDKIHWEREHYEPTLLTPILTALQQAGCRVHHLRYGQYQEEDYRALLQRVGAMVFLCEHETQGFAYLQALASGVPILAWDRGGLWRDPNYYPHLVQFAPVCSVPYFDERCGRRFADLAGFQDELPGFLAGVARREFRPRDYVVENFLLADRAAAYLKLSAGIRHPAVPA